VVLQGGGRGDDEHRRDVERVAIPAAVGGDVHRREAHEGDEHERSQDGEAGTFGGVAAADRHGSPGQRRHERQHPDAESDDGHEPGEGREVLARRAGHGAGRLPVVTQQDPGAPGGHERDGDHCRRPAGQPQRTVATKHHPPLCRRQCQAQGEHGGREDDGQHDELRPGGVGDGERERRPRVRPRARGHERPVHREQRPSRRGIRRRLRDEHRRQGDPRHGDAHGGRDERERARRDDAAAEQEHRGSPCSP
jgi:hypothetical protein